MQLTSVDILVGDWLANLCYGLLHRDREYFQSDGPTEGENPCSNAWKCSLH
jgi:hypothetical protein